GQTGQLSRVPSRNLCDLFGEQRLTSSRRRRIYDCQRNQRHVVPNKRSQDQRQRVCLSCITGKWKVHQQFRQQKVRRFLGVFLRGGCWHIETSKIVGLPDEHFCCFVVPVLLADCPIRPNKRRM